MKWELINDTRNYRMMRNPVGQDLLDAILETKGADTVVRITEQGGRSRSAVLSQLRKALKGKVSIRSRQSEDGVLLVWCE